MPLLLLGRWGTLASRLWCWQDSNCYIVRDTSSLVRDEMKTLKINYCCVDALQIRQKEGAVSINYTDDGGGRYGSRMWGKLHCNGKGSTISWIEMNVFLFLQLMSVFMPSTWDDLIEVVIFHCAFLCIFLLFRRSRRSFKNWYQIR